MGLPGSVFDSWGVCKAAYAARVDGDIDPYKFALHL